MAIQKYKGHLALLGAAIMWGLMSPIGKTALENGISGLSLATFRMTGGAVCFLGLPTGRTVFTPVGSNDNSVSDEG